MNLSTLYSLKNFPGRKIEPGVWYTPNSSGVYYDHESKSIIVNRKGRKLSYNGSFEVKFPKDYIIDKKGIKLVYSGRGLFSVKIFENLGGSGPSRQYGGTYKKLHTVRESEFIHPFGVKMHKRYVKFKRFYNKPFNVDFKAFLKGFGPVDLSKVGSCEITVRIGEFQFHQIEFV